MFFKLKDSLRRAVLCSKLFCIAYNEHSILHASRLCNISTVSGFDLLVLVVIDRY